MYTEIVYWRILLSLCQEMFTENSLLVKGGTPFLFPPPSSERDPVCLEPIQFFWWCHSLCEKICVPVLLCLQGGVFLVLSTISDLTIALPFLSSSYIPEPWGEGVDKVTPYGAEFSKISHSARCLVVGICGTFKWWNSIQLVRKR